MTRPLLALLLALSHAVGCQVDALEGAAYAGPKNLCATGCPNGSTCGSDGRCTAGVTAYPLLIEATPPASARWAPGVTFSVAVDDRRGGTRPLALPEPARVVARFAGEVPLPLALRLERVGAVPGTPAATFEAKASVGSEVTPTLKVPPGDYEVFVGPANQDDLTRYPPIQLRNGETLEPLVVTFPSGSHELRIAYGTGLRSLDVALLGPDGKAPLTDPRQARDLRVIDETTGQLASTIARTCETAGKPLRTTVSLALAPEIAGHRYALRVEPAATPCSAATPPQQATLEFDLGALDVEGRGNRVQVTIPPATNVIVSGLVTAYGKPAVGIDGDVVLRSVKLDESVDAKTGRAFSVVKGKIIDGKFREIVLPGLYHADITPSADLTRPSSDYAVCVDCSVPSQLPSAKPGTRSSEFTIAESTLLTFEVPQRVQFVGSAAGFSEDALFTVGTWEASSSTSLAGFTASGARLATRAQTGLVSLLRSRSGDRLWNLAGTDGSRVAALDPGVYDLVVRSPEASGYPWIVRPRLEVPAQRELDLGVMNATAPVVFVGEVTDPSGAPVPRATVRARGLVTASDPKKPALGAVLVGETRADDAGRYRLVVPSALTAPKKDPSPSSK